MFKILFYSLLRDILSTMEKDCQKYAVIDTNNVISKTAHWSYRSTTIVISVSVISTVFYAIGVFSSEEISATTHRKLLLKMDLPVDTDKSPVYELVVFTQYFYQATSAFVYGLFSAFLLTLVSINNKALPLIRMCLYFKNNSFSENKFHLFIYSL